MVIPPQPPFRIRPPPHLPLLYGRHRRCPILSYGLPIHLPLPNSHRIDRRIDHSLSRRPRSPHHDHHQLRCIHFSSNIRFCPRRWSPFLQLAQNRTCSLSCNPPPPPPPLSSFTLTHSEQVDPKRHIPVNALIFTFLYSTILSLINIGSTVAFNALLSLCTVALMATYDISIRCVALKRLRGEPLPPCRWSLGRYGLTINLIALVWSIWSFFWSCWPNSHHVTAQKFNWACVIFVGIMGISCLLYVVRARHIYEGPVVKVHTL